MGFIGAPPKKSPQKQGTIKAASGVIGGCCGLLQVLDLLPFGLGELRIWGCWEKSRVSIA